MTPLIATMVGKLAVTFAEQLGLETSPVLLRLHESTNSMVLHSSYGHNPAHRWLREVMAGLGRDTAKDAATVAL